MTNRYAVTGTDIETGKPWTYWDTFATQQDAFEAAERLNNAPKPVVTGCTFTTATAEHIERAERSRRMTRNG